MTKYLLVTVFTLLACSHGCPAQQNSVEGPMHLPSASAKATLDNDAVVRMTRAGLDVSLIVQTVHTQPGHYATGADDLIALKDEGVAQAVISAMVAKTSGLSERGPETAETGAVAVSPLSPDNDENGVYRKDRDGRWVALAPELVHYKSGGWVKSTLTHDIVKKDRNGEISGAQSALILRPGDELIILAPPNADAVEYQLLRFRLHPNSREFRASTGGVFNSHDGTDRDQVKIQPRRIAPRTFAFTIPTDIGGGEFGVLPPGSASIPGIAYAGKMYTFAITIEK